METHRTLKLERPLVFFDLETTGIEVTDDRVIQIAMLKVHPNGLEESFKSLVNPGIPIPESSSEVHGIRDEDVASSPLFGELVPTILNFFAGCDVAGFNSTQFDVPLLAEEFHRCGVPFDVADYRFIDVLAIHRIVEPMTLSGIYERYFDEPLEDAHDAMADVRATHRVLEAQLSKYAAIPEEIGALSEFCSEYSGPDLTGRFRLNSNGEDVFAFGKHKGRTLREIYAVEPGYFQWILNAKFSILTKNYLLRRMSELRHEKR